MATSFHKVQPEHGDSNEKARDRRTHLVLVTYPVLLGTGKRFFAEGTPPRSFELRSTKPFPTGIILSAYSVVGPLKTA